MILAVPEALDTSATRLAIVTAAELEDEPIPSAGRGALGVLPT
jgi:hypothetical protein